MNRRLLLIAGAAVLAGCATTPTRVAAPARAGFDLLEPLYSAQAGREALTIRVSSNGCTKKEDFAFFVDKTSAGPRLAFGRKRLDPCKSFAMGHADLSWKLDAAPTGLACAVGPHPAVVASRGT